MADFKTQMEVVANVKAAVQNLNAVITSMDKLLTMNIAIARSSEDSKNNFIQFASKSNDQMEKLNNTVLYMARDMEYLRHAIASINKSTNETSSAIRNLGNAQKDNEKEQTMSLSRLVAMFGLLAAAANASFGAMLQWSPSLAAAFALIRLDIGLLAMRFGEELAPVINDYVLPAVQTLTDYLENNTSPAFKQTIGILSLVVITMTAVAIGLKALKIAFGTATTLGALGMFGALLLLIFGLGLAIYFLIKAKEAMDIGDTGIAAANIFIAIGIAVLVAAAAMFLFGGATVAALAPWLVLIGAIALVIGLVAKFAIEAAKAEKAKKAWENAPKQGGSDKTVDQILAEQEAAENAPPFHSGGIFAGDRPGLALLKPRERVLTPTEQRALGMLGGGNAGQSASSAVVNNNYYVTISGGKFTSAMERRREAEMFAREVEKQNNTRGFI